MVLVGPSGCGKTTALRMLAGLEEISEGEIRIGDTIVNDLTPKERDIAMVFQSYALYPHMTVEENLAFGLKLRKLPKSEVAERVQPRGEDPPDRGVPEAQAARALGRSASARRDGPRDRPRAAGLPDGRAALEPRREAARADARRDPPAAAAARRDDDLRHARPGRGDDDGRPRRRHERRAPAAGRHAAGALRPAGQRVRRGLHRLALDQPRRGAARADERPRRRSPSATTASPSTTRSCATARRSPTTSGGRSSSASGPRTFEDASIESDAPADRRLRVTCDLTEPLGAEVLVHFSTGAPRIASSAAAADVGDDAQRLVRRGGGRDATPARARASIPKSRIAEHSEIELAVDTSRLYFFDPETRDVDAAASP